MVLLGETIYNKNCVSCHGPTGQGLAKDWKVKDENGNYPAPPLNGTAHTCIACGQKKFKKNMMRDLNRR